MRLFNLTCKRALIPGGTHGLGMAMTKGLALAGAELIINGHSADKMENALTQYKKNRSFVDGGILATIGKPTNEV